MKNKFKDIAKLFKGEFSKFIKGTNVEDALIDTAIDDCVIKDFLEYAVKCETKDRVIKK